MTDVTRGRFSLSGREAELGSERAAWWITVVYGPQLDNDKIEFLGELLQFGQACSGPWFLCGDFNMIYRAQDKNNDCLDRSA